MNKPDISNIQKDLSIPWFEQIKKTVMLPYSKGEHIYYSIKPPDYVTGLTRTVDNRFIILRQYRPAVEDYTFELPSGHVEKAETPAQAMVRELREETGCTARNLTLLKDVIPDTGRLENRLWAFYINNVEIERIPDPCENEGIEVHLVSLEKLSEMVQNGEMKHALDLCVIALAIFQKYLKL